MSTKSRALFVYCNPGHTPPDEFLKKACMQYPSWNAIAFMENGELIWSNDNGGATVDGFKSVREDESRKSLPTFHILGREEDIDKTVDENDDNVQPWVLVERGEGDENKTMVLVAVDGPLEHFATNPAPEGRPLLFVGTKLQAMVQSIWDMTGKNPDKFAEQMRMPHNQAAIETMVGEDGTVVIMTPADKFWMYYGSPKNGDEYTWGIVNDSCGYTEVKNNKMKETLKSTTADVSNTQEVQYLFRPNANIIKTQDLKPLYEKYHGKALSNNQMQKRQAASVLPEKLQEAKSDPKITVSIISSSKPAIQPGTKTTEEAVADVGTKISIKKFVDANVLEAMSPEQMEKNEAPKTTFWDQTGWKLDDYVNAKNSANIDKKLIKEFPDAAEMLLRELRYGIFQLNKDLERATKPPTEETKTVSSAASSTPARKNRFAMNG